MKMFKGKGGYNDYVQNFFVNFVGSFFVNFVGMVVDFIILLCCNSEFNMLSEWIVDIGVFDYIFFYLLLFLIIKNFIKYVYIILFDGSIKFVFIIG